MSHAVPIRIAELDSELLSVPSRRSAASRGSWLFIASMGAFATVFALAQVQPALSSANQTTASASSVSSPHGSARLESIGVPVGVTSDGSSVVGGTTVQFTVTLSSAPAQDQAVTVSTDHPATYINFPSSVTVPAGSSSVTFPVTTHQVSSSVTTTISAYGGENPVTTSVTVTP